MSEAARASLWTLPQIDGPVASRTRRLEDLDAVERDAWDRGFADGHLAGIEAARKQQQATLAECEQRMQHMGSILDFLARPVAELDDEVQHQLARLAGAIARHLVRRELKAHPDEIIAVIRETVALLPMTAREVRVHLHPEDASLVRERLSDADADRVWTITQDPMLSRGGCRVTSDNSTIDATVERRLGAAIAAMLGDERAPVVASGEPS